MRCEECHSIQRVIPLTLIGKTDNRLAIRAPPLHLATLALALGAGPEGYTPLRRVAQNCSVAVCVIPGTELAFERLFNIDVC